MEPESLVHKPSKRILALGIVVVAIIVATILIKTGASTPKQPDVAKGDTVVVRNTVNEIDSDADGLKDWEESLWRMDLNNKDTDGDGIGDLAEVQSQKDAEQKTKEELVNSATSSLFSFFEQNKNLTRTDALSRALFEQVIAFQNAGVPLTAQDATEVATLLGDAIVGPTQLEQKTVQLSDLTLITNATPEQIHVYGNAVAGALKFTSSEQNNEFFALAEFVSTGAVASLKKLTPVIDHHNAVIARLRTIPVPKEIAPTYLGLINGMQTNTLILERLKNLSADSVTVLPVLQKYQGNIEATTAKLNDIKTYLVSKKVTYTKLEDGYLLVTMY
jgi:hypothetical protein